ncbi:MAG: TldD/PmbA family protein [Agathobacter sp.]|nr:TldD/PmbA family protein [Agathobacter sp.]
MADIKKVLEKSINLIKEKGADEGQVFVTESECREFNAESGKFTLFRTLFEQDVNVTVYKEQKKGSYLSNKLDDEAVNYAVDMAMTAMESSEQDEAYGIAPYQGDVKADKGVYDVDIDKLFERAKELLEDIRQNHPKIVIQQMVVSHRKRHMVFANTNGTFCEEKTGMYAFYVGIAGHEGDVTTSLIYCEVKMNNLDKPFMDCGDVREQIRIAEEQIAMKPLEGKFTGVMVLTPTCFSQFLAYIAGLVNGGLILDGTSIWLDKLGKQVADTRLTVKMAPLDENIVCGETLTFDGFISENYDLIKDGVLSSFILNQYYAKKTGYERAKNGAYNMVVNPGEKSLEEIISSIEKGIIVGGFSGGQPAINGDFSGVAKNSFLVENGKIVGPVTETMINGNLATMLMNLVDISKEVLMNGYDVLPYAAFDGIIVSGK